MTQSNILCSNQLEDFIQKLEKTTSQLLKEIRKYGEDNVSTRFYLEEFKNFQRQLVLKQPLKETFSNSILQNRECQHQEQPNTEKSQKTPMTDQSLKPAVRRQLVLIQSQQTKCQDIYKLIGMVEKQMKQMNEQQQQIQPNPEEIKDKLLSVYSIAQGWIKDLYKIVCDMVTLLQNHLQSYQSSSISFEKSMISPDSNRRSALTSILQSMNRSDKKVMKSDSETLRQTRQSIKSTKIPKKILSKFEVLEPSQKPVLKQIVPRQRQKFCAQCLLF